jgi:hypothetical protein
MNESKWLTGTDGEAMLDFVADRLTPRHWVLLAAAYLRRLWDLLPAGALRDAIEAAERSEKPLSQKERAAWLKRIDAAVPQAVENAGIAQRQIVKTADPDAADVTDPLLARPTQIAPAFPLFRAASNHARTSIERMTEAMSEAVEAVRRLFSEPSDEMLDQVRQAVEQAAETRVRASQATADALRCKQEGDELADRAAAAKNKRLELAKAEEIVRKIEEGRSGDAGWEAEERRDRAARKQLARLLREIVGNPFKPPRFEPAWRTSTVLDLARGIFDDRAWDRLPILADALLDADCDEEQVLRHLRGTELGVKEPPQHVRGCWVVDLILSRWQPLPPADPNAPPRRRRLPDDFVLGLPDDTALA